MPRLAYSEYSGLNYPDNSWSARAHRVLRALWIIVVAATIGGIGGGAVALTLLHLTGGSPRPEAAGAAGKQQSVTVALPAAAKAPRIAAASRGAAISSAASPAAAPPATAPPAAIFAAAPHATVSAAAPPAAAPPAAAPPATAPPASATVSAAARPATAPPATALPAAVSAAAPAVPVQRAAASAVPSPRLSADQQSRIVSANKPAATEPVDGSLAGEAAAAETADHASSVPPPRALARVRRHASPTISPNRRALAENAHSRPLPHYGRSYDRYNRAYDGAKRSRYSQNWASDNWGGSAYGRGGGWGGGGYWRPGGWGGGDWGD